MLATGKQFDDTFCTRMRRRGRPSAQRLHQLGPELGLDAEHRWRRRPDVSLTIESDPPGADAKTSLGASCRTPCMIPVAADREFTVSYALNGYLPQVVTVTPRMPETGRLEPEVGGAPPAPDLSAQSGVRAAAAGPAARRRRKRAAARPKQTAQQPLR